ncbi:type III secretion system ATPase SctN [Pseudomonas gingeri]|uniref:type III secretion system ATPase SctN n=1 Tax=Pseudomonas gingeri TaxID=117681 RepID=UPI00159FA8F3|nr:type III secretion system ATPase SctN [Pseudomonas gingeri]NVZ99853.1 type III secretion system ATPase SctN [Pseudomonas gingeri]NWA16693.1 type III secretion system ATPase SctN [Pseudomonas gingeri]NWA53921.1 type III secretion system ATPase SctN [Pseudomonas gingeri]NWA94153.1 type III secretion system ATPase SctN [Pseudomonas gingeri]NWB01947.1 type III secretion system ATPase SctN [Pseudomonas gingeri]
MNVLRLERRGAHPRRLSGPLIEAALEGVSIGEICEIRRHWTSAELLAKAQVIGFRPDTVVLSLLGEARGLSRESMIVPTGAALRLYCSAEMLGSVVDPRGTIVERLAPAPGFHGRDYPVDADPPSYQQRRPVVEPLMTGIRVIDGLLTVGIGQRLGIFASAGSGKTSLLNMLINHTDADVFVIGLIGERGREVTEFIEHLRQSHKRSSCVVVYATSDVSSVDRCNAALQATAIAEYFRDQGQCVVLLLDSLTRYARARRDLALAAGEVPARRGYPASVFDALPRLLERPGLTALGSITACYTVLLESDDEPDPIAEEIRSILDGHIYLSRGLAAKGHFPAIDVLRSASRVAHQVTGAEARQLAARAREVLARLEALQVFLDLGEYTPGIDPTNDRAMACRDGLNAWLRQGADEMSRPDETRGSLHELIG